MDETTRFELEVDAPELEFQPLLTLSEDLSAEFMVVVGGIFPSLSPLDLLIASGDIREAVHHATMRVLHIVNAEQQGPAQ